MKYSSATQPEEFKRLFRRLKIQALYSKMDYKTILKDCCGLTLPDSFKRNVFKRCLKKKQTEFASLVKNWNDSDTKEFDTAKDELNDLLNIALCLVEPCDGLAQGLTTFILTTLHDIVNNASITNIAVKKWAKKLMLRAYELSCRAQFKKWTFWQPLLERGSLHSITKNEIGDLRKAESDSVLYENLLRETTETNDDDVKYRSTALTIRARALYLQGYFPQAHHFIDLASAGLSPERIEHWPLISVVHIVRAELLAISAHEHYFSFSVHDQVISALNLEQALLKLKKKIRNENLPYEDLRLENLPEEFQEFAKLAKKLEPIAASSLKKIERAVQELHHAEKLLRSMAHQSTWLIQMEFGTAQVQIEQMLFEMELLFLSRQSLTVTEYLKKSGKLEQKILDTMQRLRNVLDIIPYEPRQWDKIDEDEKEAGRSMFQIECNTFKLWRQLFVVGAYYSSLLNHLYRSDSHLKEDTTIFDIAEDFIETCRSFTGAGENARKYSEQWKLWCTAMRFDKFVGNDNMVTFKLGNSETKKTLKSVSFGATVIESMRSECEGETIEKMWRLRTRSTGSNK